MVQTPLNAAEPNALDYSSQLFINSLTISPDLGTIDSQFIGASKRIVAVLQDAHCNADAQMNQANIIETLVNDYGFTAVYCEGAVGSIDTGIFNAYPDANVKADVAQTLVREGTLSGAEYYSIVSDAPVAIQGIEDQKEYTRNYAAARSLLKTKKDFLPIVEELRKAMTVVKQRVFSKKLFELDEISSQRIVHRPQSTVVGNSSSDDRGPQTVDNKQRTAGNRQPTADIIQLLTHLFLYIETYKLDISDYPEINTFRTIVKEQKNIDNIQVKQLLKDIDSFAGVLKHMLFANKEEERVDAMATLIELLEKGVRMSLSLAESDRLFSLLTEYSFQDLQNTIEKEGLKAYVSPDTFEAGVKAVTDFYAAVSRRDDSFIKQISKAKHISDNNIIVIAGGFHSQPLAQALAKQNISYVVISPAIHAMTPEGLYYSLLEERALMPLPKTPERVLQRTFASALSFGAEKIPRNGTRINNGVKEKTSLWQRLFSGKNDTMQIPLFFDSKSPLNQKHVELFFNTVIFQLFRKQKQLDPYLSLEVFFKRWEQAYQAYLHRNIRPQTGATYAESSLKKATRIFNWQKQKFIDYYNANFRTDSRIIVPHEKMQVRVIASDAYNGVIFNDRGQQPNVISVVDNGVVRPATKEELNAARPSYSEPLSQLEATSGYSTITVSYGNLFFNDRFVLFSDGTLYHRAGEPLNARTYTCFTTWRDGSVTSEELVFRSNEDGLHVYRSDDVDGTDLRDQITCAFYGQRLVHNGESIPIAEFANEFDDLFHLFKFPQRVIDGYGVPIGHAELYEGVPDAQDMVNGKPLNRELVRQLLEGKSIVLDVSAYENTAVVEGLAQRFYMNVGEDGVVRRQGEYRWIDDTHVEILFYRYQMSHSMLGLTEDGRIIPFVLAADKTRGMGWTPEEARAEFLRQYPDVTEMFLVSTGGDAFLHVDGYDVLRPAHKRYEVASALVSFQVRREKEKVPTATEQLQIRKGELKAKVITIDGPAASGKRTVAPLVAKALGSGDISSEEVSEAVYVSLGDALCSVTYALLEMGIDIHDEDAVSAALALLTMQLRASGGALEILVNGEKRELSDIGTPRISQSVPVVAQYKNVLEYTFQMVRDLAEQDNAPTMVVEGRNAGTDLFPEHEVIKFYLDADAEVRGMRRYLQRKYQYDTRGMDAEDVIVSLRERDTMDRERAIAPLRRAPDATIINVADKNQWEGTGIILQPLIEQRLRNVRRKDAGLYEILNKRYRFLKPDDYDAMKYLIKDLDYILAHWDTWRYEPNENPKVVITILHYGTDSEGTLNLLRNLNISTYKNVEIVILDNNSQDDFYARAQRGDINFHEVCPAIADKIAVYKSDVNLGYTGGNNLCFHTAIDLHGADYVFNINNDAGIEANAIQKLVDAAKNVPEIGAITPQIGLFLDDTITLDSPEMAQIYATGVAPQAIRKKAVENTERFISGLIDAREAVPANETKPVYYKEPSMLGTAFMIRSDAIRMIGGFDTNLFMYADESDMGIKMYSTGLRKAQYVDAFIFHPWRFNYFHSYLTWRNNMYIFEYHDGSVYPMQKNFAGEPYTTKKLVSGFSGRWSAATPGRIEAFIDEHMEGSNDDRYMQAVAVVKAVYDGVMHYYEPTHERVPYNEAELFNQTLEQWSSMSIDDIVADMLFESRPYMSRIKISALAKLADEKQLSTALIIKKIEQIKPILREAADAWAAWAENGKENSGVIDHIRHQLYRQLQIALGLQTEDELIHGGQTLYDFAAQREVCTVTEQGIGEWQSAEENILSEEAVDVLFVFGSQDVKTPEHASAMYHHLVVNNPDIRIVSSGKWGAYWGLPGFNGVPEGLYFEKVLKQNGVPKWFVPAGVKKPFLFRLRTFLIDIAEACIDTSFLVLYKFQRAVARDKTSDAIVYGTIWNSHFRLPFLREYRRILVNPSSVNTGENITRSRALLESYNVKHETVLVTQIPSLQRRSAETLLFQYPVNGETLYDLGFRRVISYAPYVPVVETMTTEERNTEVAKAWGEVYRLIKYTEEGFIRYVDVPLSVIDAALDVMPAVPNNRVQRKTLQQRREELVETIEIAEPAVSDLDIPQKPQLRIWTLDELDDLINHFSDEHRAFPPVITGASGFIGSHLTDYILDENMHNEVVCLVRSGENVDNLLQHAGKKRIYVVECGDLTDAAIADKLERIIEAAPTIYHVAAQPDATVSNPEAAVRTFQSNVFLTAFIAECARRHDTKVVYGSSAHVYTLHSIAQGAMDDVIDENTPLSLSPEAQQFVDDARKAFWEYTVAYIDDPDTVDAPAVFIEQFLRDREIFDILERFGALDMDAIRAGAEQEAATRYPLPDQGKEKEEEFQRLLRANIRAHDIPLDIVYGFYGLSKIIPELFVSFLEPGKGIVLEFTNGYGDRERQSGVLQLFTSRIPAGKPVFASTDIRNFVHVSDSVRALYLAGTKDLEQNERFLIASPDGTFSMEELLRQVMPYYDPAYTEDSVADIRSSVPRLAMPGYIDSTKAQELLGFTPQVRMQDGIRGVVLWNLFKAYETSLGVKDNIYEIIKPLLIFADELAKEYETAEYPLYTAVQAMAHVMTGTNECTLSDIFDAYLSHVPDSIIRKRSLLGRVAVLETRLSHAGLLPFDFEEEEKEQQRMLFALMHQLVTRKHLWPIFNVAAAVRDADGEIMTASNSTGYGAHAENNLIFSVFRKYLNIPDSQHASSIKVRELRNELRLIMKKAGEETLQREDIVALTLVLERLSLKEKLTDDEALKALSVVSKYLGGPLYGRTIYISLHPCSNCIQKLRAVGVDQAVYYSEHSQTGFIHNSDEANKGGVLKSPARVERNLILAEENVSRQSLFMRVWNSDYSASLQFMIREMYFYHLKQSPEAAERFLNDMDRRLKPLFLADESKEKLLAALWENIFNDFQKKLFMNEMTRALTVTQQREPEHVVIYKEEITQEFINILTYIMNPHDRIVLYYNGKRQIPESVKRQLPANCELVLARDISSFASAVSYTAMSDDRVADVSAIRVVAPFAQVREYMEDAERSGDIPMFFISSHSENLYWKKLDLVLLPYVFVPESDLQNTIRVQKFFDAELGIDCYVANKHLFNGNEIEICEVLLEQIRSAIAVSKSRRHIEQAA